MASPPLTLAERRSRAASTLTGAIVLQAVATGVLGLMSLMMLMLASVFTAGPFYWFLVIVTLGLWLILAEIFLVLAVVLACIALASLALLLWMASVRGAIVKGRPGAEGQARAAGVMLIVLGILLIAGVVGGPWNLVFGILYVVAGVRLQRLLSEPVAAPAAGWRPVP